MKTPRGMIQFPVAPESLEVSFPSLNQTFNVLNFGEVSMLGSNALRTWSLSSFFPAHNYDFCQCPPLKPKDYCFMIDNLLYTRTPVRIIVPQTRLNNSASIESFNWSIVDGSRDVEFTLEFKEHKVVGQKRVVVI